MLLIQISYFEISISCFKYAWETNFVQVNIHKQMNYEIYKQTQLVSKSDSVKKIDLVKFSLDIFLSAELPFKKCYFLTLKNYFF